MNIIVSYSSRLHASENRDRVKTCNNILKSKLMYSERFLVKPKAMKPLNVAFSDHLIVTTNVLIDLSLKLYSVDLSVSIVECEFSYKV